MKKSGKAARCVIAIAAQAAMAQYGTPIDGYPNWHERAALVLINACRAEPIAYRNAYVGAYTILTAYPAQNPLYWNHSLAVCARTHAADMANKCGLSHNSCNGGAWNTRIKACYQSKASDSIAENLACGTKEPQETVKAWLLDEKAGGVIPADHTGVSGDGHRANIMAGSLRETGIGIANGPIRCDGVRSAQSWRYWAQDFGAKTPATANKIASGAHLFLTHGTTTFMANYYDATGASPQNAAVVLDGTTIALSRAFGTAARGAYSANVVSANQCRPYYFTFIDSQGSSWRYPESGTLVTFGEGACTNDYQTTATSLSLSPGISAGKKGGGGQRLIFFCPTRAQTGVYCRLHGQPLIADIRGRTRLAAIIALSAQ